MSARLNRNWYKRIIVLGSLAFDQISVLPGKFSDWIMPDKIHQLNVSFTVSSMRREFGGTGGNCAFTLGLLGTTPVLVGVLGKDGKEYKAHLESAGVNVEQVVIDEELLSAVGTVMTDLDDNQIWSFYPGPLAKCNQLPVTSDQTNSTFVALMPSEPGVFVKHLHELVKMKARFMFDPAFFIPNMSKADLKLGILHAEIVVGNDYEMALLEKKTHSTMATWLHSSNIVIRTLGAEGSEIHTKREVITIPAAQVKQVVDPTGAGDAYRAGFLAEYIKGSDIETCGHMGAKVAAAAVKSFGTQNHNLDDL
jgi:adenosine kinase